MSISATQAQSLMNTSSPASAATVSRLLEDLEQQIDEKQEAMHRRAWQGFLDDEVPNGIFTPPRRRISPARVEWPSININDALEDTNLMLLREFGAVSAALSSGSGDCLGVRSNFGTGIIPSLFGCELFIMPRETNTLPTTHPCASLDAIRALVDSGVPDLSAGLGARVFECAERFLEVFERHPVLNRNVALYHPDLQGPIDLVELIWGSGMFIGIYDEPELLKQLLQLVTETYMCFMEKWLALVPSSAVHHVHWGLMLKGRLMIRNDSLTNLSPEMYVEYVRPYDQQLFDRFGGGAIHFCGHGDHFIAAMSEMRGLTAINTSQPHLNDMEKIFKHTVDKGIKLIGLNQSAVENVQHPLRGQVQC